MGDQPEIARNHICNVNNSFGIVNIFEPPQLKNRITILELGSWHHPELFWPFRQDHLSQPASLETLLWTSDWPFHSPRLFLSGGGSRSLSLSESNPADITALLRPGPPLIPASLKDRCMALASSAVNVEALYFERIDLTDDFCASVSEPVSEGFSRTSLVPVSPFLSSPLWTNAAPEKSMHVLTAITATKVFFLIFLLFMVCRTSSGAADSVVLRHCP